MPSPFSKGVPYGRDIIKLPYLTSRTLLDLCLLVET
jgi:hypothetical protein